MMNKSFIVPKNTFALDLGTTKFCIGGLKKSVTGDLRFEVVSVPAAGMRRGMIANKGEAQKAIEVLLETAEAEFQTDIRRCILGVAGSHIQHQLVTGKISLGGSAIHLAQIKEVLKKIEKEWHAPQRELLHCLPAQFQVDQREAILDPIGFSGLHLTAESFVVHADKYYLKDVVAVCNEAGLEVSHIWAEPILSAISTVPPAKRQQGIAVVDIGGGTTDGVVFVGGRPVDLFTINVAGHLMTNDLAVGLKLPLDEAERAKLGFGIKANSTNYKMVVTDLHGARQEIGWNHVYPILAPRVVELATLIGSKIAAKRHLLAGGLVITGGGAELMGIEQIFAKILKIPITRTVPRLTDRVINAFPNLAMNEQQVCRHAKYATLVGLMCQFLDESADDQIIGKSRWGGRYFGSLISWLREMS